MIDLVMAEDRWPIIYVFLTGIFVFLRTAQMAIMKKNAFLNGCNIALDETMMAFVNEESSKISSA